MSRNIVGYLAAALTAVLSQSALHAQERAADQNENHIAVGVAFVDQHTPFKGNSTQPLVIPVISIRQGAFYFEGAETGVHLATSLDEITPSLDLFVAARSPWGRDRTKVTADGGARLSLQTGLGTLSGEFRHDLTDTFNGSEVIARYSYTWSAKRFSITPAVQASWLDRKAANYMYGITAAQRARMIRKGRSFVLPVAPITHDALNLGGDLTMALQLNERLTLNAVIGGAYLDKSIRRSAAIDQKWEAQSGLGLTYRF